MRGDEREGESRGKEFQNEIYYVYIVYMLVSGGDDLRMAVWEPLIFVVGVLGCWWSCCSGKVLIACGDIYIYWCYPILKGYCIIQTRERDHRNRKSESKRDRETSMRMKHRDSVYMLLYRAPIFLYDDEDIDY